MTTTNLPEQPSTWTAADAPDAAITIVANRLPVTRVDADWELSPGGLVRALIPVMRARRGVWIGWGGAVDHCEGEFEHDGLRLIDIELNQQEHDQYYCHVANGIIWPLFHDAVRQPDFNDDAWQCYVRVNQRFAQAAAEHTPEGGTVWIHDYHFLLVPGMVRAMRPDVRIGFFLHIPVPPSELLATLPWRDSIAESLTAADLIGTQTRLDASHLKQFLTHPSPAEPRDARRTLSVTVDAFPISINTQRFSTSARRAENDGSAAILRQRFGEGRTIFLGVDRLDYTKGIDRRLEAFELALEQDMFSPDEVVFVQVAVPSRESIAEYSDIGERVDALVGRINGLHGGMTGVVVHYIKSSLDADDLVALYRAADVMVVTPLRDGMNLVAKEFVATRFDGTGELILSEFAGAAHELTDATIVNPHDVRAIANAMSAAHQRRRDGRESRNMKQLYDRVCRHDVHQWSRSFLERLGAPRRPPAASASPG